VVQHSGDIGEWTKSGALRIIDRKKHIFKLAQGEYIAPEKIEAVYTRSPLVAQAYVHGDSLESALVAVVVPDEEPFVAWAKANSHRGSPAELCVMPAVVAAFLAELQSVGHKGKLKSFEQVKAVHLCKDLFSVENGLLTPTFKSKRPALHARYNADIVAMYAALAAVAPKAKL
jgi:long-chain acyl-CoA synthetase